MSIIPVSWIIEPILLKHPDPGTGPCGLLQSKCLRQYDPRWGHPGSQRILHKHFWQSYMLKGIKTFVASSPVCVQSKKQNPQSQGLLQPLPIPHRPMSHLSMVFVTCLPASVFAHHVSVFIPCLCVCTIAKCESLAVSKTERNAAFEGNDCCNLTVKRARQQVTIFSSPQQLRGCQLVTLVAQAQDPTVTDS